MKQDIRQTFAPSNHNLEQKHSEVCFSCLKALLNTFSVLQTAFLFKYFTDQVRGMEGT